MSTLITGSSGNTSLWSKPEGKFGAIISVALTALFGYGFYKILPSLVSMAHNVFVLGLYCVAIAMGFYVLVLDSRLRNMFVNFYGRLIRALYILSFNVDPIGGLKDGIKALRGRISEAQEQAGKVKGQAQATALVIEQNEEVIRRGLELMATAQKANRQNHAKAESIKVGAAQEANRPLVELKVRLDRSFSQLQSIIEKGSLNVDVLETIVQVKERSFKAAKAGRSAMRAAMQALTGDPDKDGVFQMNMEWIDEYTAEAVGEMDAMLELNASAIDSIDLQQMSYSDKAFQMLEERQDKVGHLLAQDERAQKLITAPFDAGFQQAQEAVPVSATSATGDFDRLFDRSRAPKK